MSAKIKMKILNTKPYAPIDGWPKPLGKAAYHGLAADFVDLVTPQSEADPAAILIQFLVAFGNVIGHHSHFQVESDNHYCNMFAVLVGTTAKSRKGTSWGHVRKLFAKVDPEWETGRIKSGLASGEGLISEVRDKEPYSPGSHDKRLLVMDAEFSSTLQVLGRPGSILSPRLRDAWDGRPLMNLPKKDPLTATDAHVSVVGHVTELELRRSLTKTEAGNGFANRFLWVCVKRKQLLPNGGRLDDADLEDLAEQLKGLVRFADQHDPLYRDAHASVLWREVYERLSTGEAGLFGAVTARAEAYVMRLACIYALLDRRSTIKLPHLQAALEVWRYCEDSARHIFGDATGDSIADTIMRELKLQPDGITRYEIGRLFKGNKPKTDIDRALSILESAGHAQMTKKSDGGRGRPVERWSAVERARA